MDILNTIIKLTPLASIIMVAYAYIDISKKLDKLATNIKKIEKEFILDEDEEDSNQKFTSESDDSDFDTSSSKLDQEEKISKKDEFPDLISSSSSEDISSLSDDEVDKEEEIDILNEFKYYEGKPLDEVAKYAASSGYTLRIIETDGKKTKYTETKYNSKVLNISVKEVFSETLQSSSVGTLQSSSVGTLQSSSEGTLEGTLKRTPEGNMLIVTKFIRVG